MARPIKTGLDYFPQDVTIFNDRKIRRLITKCGGDGFMVYEYLKCLVYSNNGYFIDFDEDLIFDIADALRLAEDQVEIIIETCCKLSLFDCDLMEQKILTSRGIQRRYLEINKSSKRKNIKIDPKLSLLNTEETPVNTEETPFNTEETPFNTEETPKKAEESTQSKVKENKIKEIYRPLAGFDYEFEKGKSGFYELLPYWESVSTEIENQVLEHQIGSYLAQIDARAFAAQYRMTKNEMKDYLQRWAAKFMEQNDKLAEVQIKIKSFQRYLTNVRNNKK